MSLSTILLIVIGIAAALYFGHKGFKQLVRIWFNQTVKAGSTAVQREEDEYNRLIALLPVQEEAVTSVMADARTASKDLKTAQDAANEAEKNYNDAEDLKATEGTLDSLATSWEEAKKQVADMAAIATEAKKAADEARDALDETAKALKKFEQQLVRDKAKEKLTKALNITADARKQTKDMQAQIGAAAQASREVDHDLEQARARNELSQGTEAERELKELKAKSGAKSAREELKARRAAGQTGTQS